MNILIHHGWMHQAADLQALGDALRTAGHDVYYADRGYFGPLQTPDLSHDGPWLALGHSLGYYFAHAYLRARGIQPIAGVQIAGFHRFPEAQSQIARLRLDLAQNPQAAYRKFRRRCGYDATDPLPAISPSGAQRLCTDLQILENCDLTEPLVPSALIHGILDRIVPVTYALQEMHAAAADIYLSFNAGHALTPSFLEFCARKTAAYIDERTRAANPEQAALADDHFSAALIRPEQRSKRNSNNPSRDHLGNSGNPVAAAFSAAAQSYDRHADVQRATAAQLVQELQAFTLFTDDGPSKLEIADIGAGTGLLTQFMRTAFPKSHICAYDFAPKMVAQLQQTFGTDPSFEAILADGETVVYPAPIDLCASSFCWQWFTDPAASIRHHLQQSRVLALALPIAGTFATWRAAIQAGAGIDRVRHFWEIRDILACMAAQTVQCAELHIYTRHVEFPDAYAFLRSMRAIGAHTPQGAASASHLRRILRTAPTPFVESYRVAILLVRV